MNDVQELLGQIPVQQIASMLGTDTASTQAAVEAAVPTLLAGMQNNVQAPDGAAALESELARHRNGLADGGVDPSQLDTQDGEKIVGHVFGGQQDQVANRLAGTANLGGVGGDLVRKLLPILAPIVMSYLARKVLGGGQGAGGQSSPAGGGILPRPAAELTWGAFSEEYWAVVSAVWAPADPVPAVTAPAGRAAGSVQAALATSWAAFSAAAHNRSSPR
jgi:hypothetical protein